MNMSFAALDHHPGNSIHKAPSETDVLSIDGIRQCYGYNLTLADSDNGTLIEAVRYDRCGGSTLTSYVVGKPSEFCHLKGIFLNSVPITELTTQDLMHFPELQVLYVKSVKITHMENGLLCYNSNITFLQYDNSFGFLTAFPSQIFNCTMPLKLEYFCLKDHDIASLPAHAFGSAAEQLRVLSFENAGLEVIHEDAFTGLMKLQYVFIQNNNLLHISGAMIPPSTHLKLISCMDNRIDGNLNLTTMHIAKKCNLQMFWWIMNHISFIEGSFCSHKSKSELEIVHLEGISSYKSKSKLQKIHFKGNTSMGTTLPPDVLLIAYH